MMLLSSPGRRQTSSSPVVCIASSLLTLLLAIQLLLSWPPFACSKQVPLEDARQCDRVDDGSDRLKCGQTALTDLDQLAAGSHRIYGGHRALPGEFPFMVSVQRHFNISGLRVASYCGGVILDERFVLTAAHCVMNNCTRKRGFEVAQPSQIELWMGSLNLRNKSHGEHHRVERVIAHNFCHPSSKVLFSNDIALLKTTKPIKFKLTPSGHGSVNRICLPGPDRLYNHYEAGLTVLAAGWGSTEFARKPAKGWPTKHLLATYMKLMDLEQCRQLWQEAMVTPEKVICTASEINSVCQGDSGGPLMKMINGQYHLLGLVSFGSIIGCSTYTQPDVYTRVSHHLDWIKAQVDLNS